MGEPRNPIGYANVWPVLNRALDEPNGVFVPVADQRAGEALRHRLYGARRADRKKNIQIYPDPQHPLHNASPWDALIFTIETRHGRLGVLVNRGEDLELVDPETGEPL